MRITPVTGEVYHVYNRGVEKRTIFSNRLDYVRFIHDLFEFNDTRPAPEFDRRYKPQKFYVGNPISHISHIKNKARENIVEILCFCLMGNHYHMLVKQIKDGGIPLFMQKLGIGYTIAFNAKNDRVGPLFQGKYKSKHVDKEEYLKYLICYIHLNPLKFLKVIDQNGKMNFSKTWKKLNTYRWSSHLDYLGDDNFGSVIEKKFILDIFGSVADYKAFMRDWMKYEADKLEFISEVAIDLD